MDKIKDERKKWKQVVWEWKSEIKKKIAEWRKIKTEKKKKEEEEKEKEK